VTGTGALRTVIEANLGRFERAASPVSLTPAAVAIVVVDHDGEPAIPIFERTADMKRHAGQMALPGGRVHDGESVEECALRELHEEVGLRVDPAGVLGRLDDFETRSGFTITPVVVWSGAPAGTLQPSPDEVAHLFVIPITDLRRAVGESNPGWSEEFSLRLSAVEVFAPTAAMLYQFSEVALDGRPARVADFFQPPFTHR